jgi:hypothetical protein
MPGKRVPGAEVVEEVDLSSSDEDEESNVPSQSASNVSSARKRRLSSSEDESAGSADVEQVSGLNSADQSRASSPGVTPVLKKRRVTIESDDDMDEEEEKVEDVSQKSIPAVVDNGTVFFMDLINIF